MLYNNSFKAVENFFKTYCCTNKSVCVAVSGGSDSIALFNILLRIKEKLKIKKLGIAHVNHNLRGQASKEDALFVKNVAKKTNTSFHLFEIDKKEIPQKGIEEWARKKRYDFFNKILKEYNYDYIATGHTANDRAETIVMRLMRGCGINGLCGIFPVKDQKIIRPLLNVTRSNLRNWLRKNKISFREDASNYDISFTRNWVRHIGIPFLGKKEKKAFYWLIKISENALKLKEVISLIIEKWINKNVVFNENNIIINTSQIFDDVIFSEILAFILKSKGIRFNSHHIDTIIFNKKNKRLNKVFLLTQGWKYEIEKKSIIIFNSKYETQKKYFCYKLEPEKEYIFKDENCKLILRKFKKDSLPQFSFDDPFTAWLDAEKVEEPLFFRNWKMGEKFFPFGKNKYVDLNEFLKKQKIGKKQRLSMGVVSQKNGEIIWIPGQRISNKVKIIPQTKIFYKICIKPIK
jgi:tRNA(Ile)-lysidine synthase